MPKKPAAPVPEVLPAEHPDLSLTQTEGGSIAAFLSGLTSFFHEAGRLERRSEALHAEALSWTVPTDGSADRVLTEKVRNLAVDKRAVEDHWQVTAVISRFHRRLTAARDRALRPLDEASQIGNRLHNEYADRERRRAQQEEDRKRREAEDRARQDREAELARLEAEALAAEKDAPELTEREQRFVDLYCGSANLTPFEAAKKAGYRNVDAAPQLLATLKIRQAIEATQQAIRIRQQAEAARTAPVERTHVEVKPDIATNGVTRYSANVVDVEALLAAVLDPMTRTRYGIPADIIQINPTKLNEYARALHEQIERWPGVRLVKTTSIR